MSRVLQFPGGVPDDEPARERIRSSLDESLVVEAAAGTGKTTALVERVVGVLASGRGEVDGLVAVTFTRKAAGELKLRLRLRLDEARSEAPDPDVRERLSAAISRLEEARIGTIHSFCAELLRERPVEAGIDPDFVEVDEDEARRLFARAFDGWIQTSLEQSSPALRRALARLAHWRYRADETPLDRLRSAAWQLAEWRDHPASWSRPPWDRPTALAALADEVVELASMAEGGPSGDPLRKALGPVVETGDSFRRLRRTGSGDDDGIEALLAELWRRIRTDRRQGRGRRYGPHGRDEVLAARDGLLDRLSELVELADADLAAGLRIELGGVVSAYEELKRREGSLDFLDLLIETRDLLRGQPDVRAHFQRRFTHLFVDEFQDTDPLQAEILLLLASDDESIADWRAVRPAPGKLFIVGDPKQSIYRFRRADVVFYQGIKEQLERHEVATVALSKSFRSRPAVQGVINASFEPEMVFDPEIGQPSYIPLGRARPRRDEQPSVIALPAPRPYGWRRVTGRAIEACLPDTVGAFVEWLLRDSGWMVEDPESRELVPVQSSHVALLFRRYVSYGRDVSREYARALEDRDVPHVLHGARSFLDREEVETLRNALRAVEWPDDELSVFATLKGSLFALGDAELLRFRFEVGSLHPFRGRPEDLPAELSPTADALGLLADLHRRRNRRPIAETIAELLRFTRAHAGFALRPAGHQVLANVLHVCDLARAFEQRGGLSFRGFVERLDAQAGSSAHRQSPVIEEGAEGVRLMTVHGAKGLEFPVVVLVDPTCRLSRSMPSSFVDSERSLWAGSLLGWAPRELRDHVEIESRRDEAEGVRLAYVAATRARDLLVVTAVGDEPFDGWLGPLNRAIYPPAQSYRHSRPAPGCPPFGEVSVLARPSEYDGRPEKSVRPGLHQAESGRHEVVWWDPAALRLGVTMASGLRREDVLTPAGDDQDDGSETHAVWAGRRRQADEQGRAGSFDVKSVGDAGQPPGDWREIQVEIASSRTDRPGGLRFGTLVHELLESVELEADGDAVADAARRIGRRHQATEPEIDAAIESVVTALTHPLLERARTAEERLREVPVTIAESSSELVEGTVDLAFREGDSWVVVDYKTDRPGGETWRAYQHQVGWYVYALARLTGGAVEGYLLRV